MKRLFVIPVLLLSSLAFGSAAKIYVTPDGAVNGNCVNDGTTRISASGFDNVANWGSAATQIGAGTLVVFCGSFTTAVSTTMFQPQGDGAAGNPVDLKFDTGTTWTSDAATAFIDFGSHQHFILDGGTTCGWVNRTRVVCNGKIYNNLNGFAGQTCPAGPCTQQVGTVAIQAHSANDIEIKNLEIGPIYVHGGTSDLTFSSPGPGAINAPTNANIHNNLIHDCGWCLTGQVQGTVIANNEEWNLDHGFGSGINSDTTLSYANFTFHDNYVHDTAPWDQTNNAFHHDGVHVWAYCSSTIGLSTVNTNGTAVTWASGAGFTANGGMTSTSVAIGSTFYTVASVNSNTSLTLTTSAGVQTGVAMQSLGNGQDLMQCPNVSISVVNIYNNLFGGDWGSHNTAEIFFEGNIQNANIFNNVNVATATGAYLANGFWDGYGNTVNLFNNTSLGTGGATQIYAICGKMQGPGIVAKNNACTDAVMMSVNSGYPLHCPYPTLSQGNVSCTALTNGSYTLQTNLFASPATISNALGTLTNSFYSFNSAGFASFESDLGSPGDICKTNDGPQCGNSSVEPNGTWFSTTTGAELAGSPSIGAGTNLTALCTGLGISGNPCNKDINGNARPAVSAWDIGATQLSYELTVAGAGSGAGTVTSGDGNISCTLTAGVASGTCSWTYLSGTSVTLTESASGGSGFTGWSGGICSGTSATCSVTMNQTSPVTATFNLTTAPAITLSCSPSLVLNGSTTVCTWTVTGGPFSACSIAGIDITASCASGNHTFTVNGQTTYTLSARNSNGPSTNSFTVDIGGSVQGANTIRTANTVVQ